LIDLLDCTFLPNQIYIACIQLGMHARRSGGEMVFVAQPGSQPYIQLGGKRNEFWVVHSSIDAAMRDFAWILAHPEFLFGGQGSATW
jgi:hypothetical protein